MPSFFHLYFRRHAVAAAMLASLLLPGIATAAPDQQVLAAAPLKSLSLRLADIQHVYGSGLTVASAGANRKSIDLTCANAPTVGFTNSFSTSNGSAVQKSGLLNITAQVFLYRSTAGPRCNFKYDLYQRKLLGTTLGVVTTLAGVGDQAVLIRLDSPKGAPGPPVYTLDARFIRDRYLVLVIVQLNRKIRPADVTSLARAVDRRIKQSG